MKRSQPLRRSTPMKRGTRIKARNAKRGGHRFPKGVDEDFREFVRGLPCILRSYELHRCTGEVQCCHVKTRGAGGRDAGNCFPACDNAHRQQHIVGIKTFADIWSLDLRAIAEEVWTRYPGPTPGHHREDT